MNFFIFNLVVILSIIGLVDNVYLRLSDNRLK